MTKMLIRRFSLISMLCLIAIGNSFGQLTFVEVQTPTTNTIKKVHFTTEHDGWAFTAQGQILKSDDEGHSWEIVYSDANDIFWSMSWADENHGWLSGPATFVRTKDGGETWEQMSLLNPTDEYDAVFFVDSLNGYLGVYRAPPTSEFFVYKTGDGGETWAQTNFAISDAIFFNFDFVDLNNGWVSTAGHVAYTTDGGSSWTESYPGTPYYYNWVDILDVNHAWAITDSGEVNWTSDATFWSYQSLSSNQDINQVEMLNQSFGACVGNNNGFWIFQGGAWAQVSGVSNGLDLKGLYIENESKMWLCGQGGKIYRGEVTPTDAIVYFNDVPDTICGSYEFDVLATVVNTGDYPISDLVIKLYVDDVLQSTLPWTGSLNPTNDEQFNLGSLTINGPSEIKVHISGDSVTFNNEVYHEPYYIPSTTAGVTSPVIGCRGDQVDLNAWGGNSYLWYQANDDGSNLEAGDQITVQLGDMIQYHVLIIQDFCTFEDSILVDESGCAQVTAFSPNGDNVNDFLYLENLDVTADNSVIIYNRWGDEVQKINNYNNEDVVWRGGSYTGGILPAGTYYLVINSSTAESFTSWVQIVR